MAGWNWENLPRCTPAPALSNLCSGKHVSEEIYSAKSIWSGSCLFVNVLAVPHHPCSRRPLRCMCTQGGASGTRDEGAWEPRSRFRQKLHPSSQAWPLLSASNRGETAIAKCPNWLVTFPELLLIVWAHIAEGHIFWTCVVYHNVVHCWIYKIMGRELEAFHCWIYKIMGRELEAPDLGIRVNS